MSDAVSGRTEPHVPCECCTLEIPVRDGHMLRQGGWICDGCYRVLAGLDEPATPASPDPEGAQQ